MEISLKINIESQGIMNMVNTTFLNFSRFASSINLFYLQHSFCACFLRKLLNFKVTF